MREIHLSNGQIALVDDCDYEAVSKFKWHANRAGEGRATYATAHCKGKTIQMHNLIIDRQPGMVTDHINGNALDNRKENLRLVTHSQNAINRKKKGSSSKYKGVHRYYDHGWRACIQHQGKRVNIGVFRDEVEAALAYDRQAFLLFGDFAYLNFPSQVENHKQSTGCQDHSPKPTGMHSVVFKYLGKGIVATNAMPLDEAQRASDRLSSDPCVRWVRIAEVVSQ